MKNFLVYGTLLLVVVLAFALTSKAQDRLDYFGGGAEIGNTGATNTSTIKGGFAVGKYSFFRNFEFQGKMKISDQSKFGYNQSTTVEIDPLMLMALPLDKAGKVKFLVGGGVVGQMITQGVDDKFNPDLVAGIRINEKYQFTGGLVFNEMTGNAFDTRYRSIRGNVKIVQPINDRYAFYFDTTVEQQCRNLMFAPKRTQASVGVGVVIK